MNKIIEVNEKLTYVVVEPGVTFFDLDNYFKEHNIDLWISAPALGWGSVVGNVSRSLLAGLYSFYRSTDPVACTIT
jgi:hypothetical protein